MNYILDNDISIDVDFEENSEEVATMDICALCKPDWFSSITENYFIGPNSPDSEFSHDYKNKKFTLKKYCIAPIDQVIILGPEKLNFAQKLFIKFWFKFLNTNRFYK